MPLYQYDSFNRRGERVSGTIDAATEQAAKQVLQGQGLMPYKIILLGTSESKFSLKSLFEKKIDTKVKVIFTKQLSVLLRSGVPLLQAFELLTEQFEGKFKRVIISIKDGIKSGESLASLLQKYPNIFSNVYIQLVKAGEASGKLHLILDRLTGYLEREEEIKRKVKKAMSYPIFMMSFSFLVIVGLITFLVPRITDLFVKMGLKETDLPGPTLFLKNISDFLLNNYLWFSVLVICLIFLFSYWKSTDSGKYKLDEIFLKFTLTSYFTKTKAVAQFSKTLGMLLESGVNLSDALDIVCNIVENKVLVEKLKAAKDKIIKEGKMSKYLKDTGIFPNIAIYMINTGEQSGKLGQMLLTVGNDYERELSDITDSLVGKIGPMMTIITGGIIAFIVISVFLPIIDLSSKFSANF